MEHKLHRGWCLLLSKLHTDHVMLSKKGKMKSLTNTAEEMKGISMHDWFREYKKQMWPCYYVQSG
jgi:hypothetical protein